MVTPRLTSFCWKTSFTAFILISSAECSMMASVPSIAIWDFESFRSKRVLTSFIACWMALATSARSILLTISKLLSGMECHCNGCCREIWRPAKSPDYYAERFPLEVRTPKDRSPQVCTHEGNRRGIVCAGWIPVVRWVVKGTGAKPNMNRHPDRSEGSAFLAVRETAGPSLRSGG